MQILKSKSKNTRNFGFCIIFHNSNFYIEISFNFKTWLIGF